jgi:hypothetical protein
MHAKDDRPVSPLDAPEYWRRLGAEAGRRNEPRIPTGDSPVRASLISIWSAELHQERLAALDALDALDGRRANVKRRLHEVHAQASSDPRQAAALPIMMERDRALTIERATLCERYRQTVETLTQRALECDATWRSANERNRDRRILVEPTDLSIPAGIVDLPADPLS